MKHNYIASFFTQYDNDPSLEVEAFSFWLMAFLLKVCVSVGKGRYQ